MSESKSFIREAAILTVANFAVKIIGVVFKIPLTNIMGRNIGIFQAAYSIYAMLFMLSTGGLPVAISRMVASSNGRGRGKEADKISKISIYLFGIIGLVFSVLLIIFAPFVSRISGHEESALAMRIIAPALFFVCVISSVRGYFQGLRNMYPTAISEFIEAFFKLAVGLLAVVIASNNNWSVEVQAACAISGVSVGSMISMIFLLIYRRFSKKSHPDYRTDECEDSRKLLKMILVISIPITLTAAALYFSQFLDTLVIVNGLTASGESAETADTLYSAYTGLAVPIYDLLPSALVFPIATSILPAVSSALACNNKKEASALTRQSIRLSGIISFPCGVFLFVAGRSCISLLYGASKWTEPVLMADGSEIAPLSVATISLAILAFAVFFISSVSTTNSLLNAYGYPHLPFISVMSGVAALIVSEILLVRSPIGVFGAPIASIICYTIALGLNIHFLRKHCGVRLKVAGMFARPLLSSIVTFVITFFAYWGSTEMWKALAGSSPDSRLGSFVILMITGIIMVISYVISILVFRGIKEDEVRLLPKGNFIADRLIKKGWLRKNTETEAAAK